MDKLNKNRRSWNMSRIRSKNTKPELMVRKALRAESIKYSVHSKTLSGHPDIVMRAKKIAVFVHGCFWHGHSKCVDGKIPKTNTKFWKTKILANKRRDIKSARMLGKNGWKVFFLRECEIEKNIQRAVRPVLIALKENAGV